ncbi:MAG: hypothetical protein IJI14_14730 [Anaerolineaceae bacterium]|nr:hypothetical protein [Anaerolineaceae bacterium]
MAYFPNTREKTIKNSCSGEMRENGYWEGNLSPENKKLMMVYDFAAEDAADFFDNADGFCYDVSESSEVLIPKKVYTITIETLKEKFLEFIEIKRNDMVVSLIENQPKEKEQEECMEQV